MTTHICPVCSVQLDDPTMIFIHFKCLELRYDYPENRIVCDTLIRKPDIFLFLFEILKSQIIYPERFIPIPEWFATDGKIDMDRVTIATNIITISWRTAGAENDMDLIKKLELPLDVYMLARFMILSCPLQLECVNKVFSATSIQQYKVTWNECTEQQWEKSGEGRVPEYLYHGSRVSNWYSILRNGIKVMSGTTWMSAGAAHGTGIYCSNDLALSWGYSQGGYGPIIIGVYEIWNSAIYKKTTNIFVIPDENKLRLRYLIYMPNSTNVNVGVLNSIMRDNWLKVGANKAAATEKTRIKINARILKETKLLQDAGLPTDNTECLITEYNGLHIKIMFPHQFPFSPPSIIYSVEGEEVQIDTSNWNPRSSVLECIQNALK